MSTDSDVRFTRLNDANYAEWSIRMEAIFIKKGLWSVVSVEVSNVEGKDEVTLNAELATLLGKRSASKMAEARAEMILRVDDGQLSHMYSSDPRDIWLTLKRVHRAAGFATSLALRRRFLTTKKTGSQTMQAWIGSIKSLAFRLKEAGLDVSDQDTILALTMGLPTAYDAVIINFDATPTELLTLDHVITRLLNEETRQAASVDKIESEDPEHEALAVQSGRFKGQRTRFAANSSNDSGITCYFCDTPGHYKSECPEKLEWELLKKKKGKGTAAAVYLGSDSDDEGDGVF